MPARPISCRLIQGSFAFLVGLLCYWSAFVRVHHEEEEPKHCVVYKDTDTDEPLSVLDDPPRPAGSANECCQQCITHPQCRAWTLQQGSCILKWGLWKMGKASGTETGWVASSAQVDPPTWTTVDWQWHKKDKGRKEAERLMQGLQAITHLRGAVHHEDEIANTLEAQVLHDWHNAGAQARKPALWARPGAAPRPASSGLCMLLPGWELVAEECRGNSTAGGEGLEEQGAAPTAAPTIPLPEVLEYIVDGDECCDRCMEHPEGCKSFDYSVGSRKCTLNFCAGKDKVYRVGQIGGIVFTNYNHNEMQKNWMPHKAGG